jgi:hypothetical protein
VVPLAHQRGVVDVRGPTIGPVQHVVRFHDSRCVERERAPDVLRGAAAPDFPLDSAATAPGAWLQTRGVTGSMARWESRRDASGAPAGPSSMDRAHSRR